MLLLYALVFSLLLVSSLSFSSFQSKSSFVSRLQMSAEIKVSKKVSEEIIKKLGIRSWPTWGCGVSKFPWTYGDSETCLILKGKVTVTPKNGTPVTIEEGDMAVFPSGMNCEWDVTEAISKHYNFD